jgi:hypothetical protein
MRVAALTLSQIIRVCIESSQMHCSLGKAQTNRETSRKIRFSIQDRSFVLCKFVWCSIIRNTTFYTTYAVVSYLRIYVSIYLSIYLFV